MISNDSNATKNIQNEGLVVNERDAAALLGLSPSTLRIWRSNGKGPRFARISSHCIRYRREDLHAFVEKHLVDPGE